MKEIEYWKSTQLESYPNEEWRDIPNYEGLYQVSNLGRVKSLERRRWNGIVEVLHKPHILKQNLQKGYPFIDLSKDNHKNKCAIHRLVASVFLANPYNKPCIDHINTIKNDNRVENLRWVTNKENSNNPLTKSHQSEAAKAKDNRCYKRGKEHPQSIPIIQLSNKGNFIREWDCRLSVEKELGIHSANIWKVLKGKRSHAGGYKWVYLSEYKGA